MAWIKNIPRRPLLIIAVYYALALLIVGQAPWTLFTHFIGTQTGDSYEMARNAWSFVDSIRQGQSVYYQTSLGYPTGIDASLFMTVPLQYFPIWLLAFFLPLVVAYNSVVLLWMALNGWAMSFLAERTLKLSFLPALLAGLVYMAYPVFQAHLAEGHGGLMVGWGAPLYVWALFRLKESASWRNILATIAFFYLSTTGHILQAVYVVMPITGVFLLALLYQRNWGAFWRVTFTTACAAGLVLAILFPAVRNASGETAYADIGGYVRYSADLLAIVSPSFFHPVYDALLSYPRQVLGSDPAENIAYVGVIVAILATIAIVKVRESRWWLLLAVIGWVLSLGSLLTIFKQPVQLSLTEYLTYIPLPFALLEGLPGFSLARTPARFNFILALSAASLAGYGVSWLMVRLNNPRKQQIGVLFIAIAILFDYQTYWGFPLRPAEVPSAIAELRADTTIRAVYNMPYQHALAVKDALYLQTIHEHPLIGGQITRDSPVNPAQLAILQETADPILLAGSGADVVILHRFWAQQLGILETLETRLTSQLGAPSYQDDSLAIYRVPATFETPDTIFSLPAQGTTPDNASAMIYTPDPVWVTFSGELQAENRSLIVALDGNPIHRFEIANMTTFIIPLALESGYHHVQLRLDPPCPVSPSPILSCDVLNYRVAFSPTDIALSGRASFENDILLGASAMHPNENMLDVWLWWRLNSTRPETDRRFVHVVNQQGVIVAQEDVVPLMRQQGDQWMERVSIDISALPAGLYTVRTGWYDFDTSTNYLTDGESAYQIGTWQRD